MTDKLRAIRIIEYVGTHEWVESQLLTSIHGTKVLPDGQITAVTLRVFTEKGGLEVVEGGNPKFGTG